VFIFTHTNPEGEELCYVRNYVGNFFRSNTLTLKRMQIRDQLLHFGLVQRAIEGRHLRSSHHNDLPNPIIVRRGSHLQVGRLYIPIRLGPFSGLEL